MGGGEGRGRSMSSSASATSSSVQFDAAQRTFQTSVLINLSVVLLLFRYAFHCGGREQEQRVFVISRLVSWCVLFFVCLA